MGVQSVPPVGDASYTQAVEVFAREVKPLVNQSPEAAASVTAEAEGCGLDGDGQYGDALYTAAEPLASGIELVSAEDDCNEEHIKCFRRCMNNPNPPSFKGPKGSAAHYRHCTEKCRKEYVDCMKKAGLMREFSVMDAALTWLKDHATGVVVGTVVVVGGVVYVVSTGGSGLTLLPAVL
jgi:hypothetical protein